MLAVEVICHGVPSPTVWHNYLEEISARLHGGLDAENIVFPSLHNKRALAITSINFRDKRLGWKKYGFSLGVQSSPYGAVGNSVPPSISEIYQPFNENRYMQAFLRNWSLRPSCFACKSKGGSSQADLTIGDFWGIDKYPEFTDTDDGTSCVIAHSMRGIQILNDLSDINLLEVNYQQIFADNPSLEKSVIETDKAKKFRKLFPKIGFTRTMEKLEHTPFCEKLRVNLRYRLSLILNKQN